MKITQSQLVQIIKEEAANFKKEIALKKELAQIERQLNEVHAGALHDAGETAGKKYKPEFKKKGTHLIEVEDEMEDSQEDLMNAIKVIAKACGLSGTIELEDEEDLEIGDEGEEDEVEVDVDVEDEEGEGDEGDEGDEEVEEEITEEDITNEEITEEDITNEEMTEEDTTNEEVKEEGMKEEGMKEEGMKEEGATEEGNLNESYEMKRMKQLAGII